MTIVSWNPPQIFYDAKPHSSSCCSASLLSFTSTTKYLHFQRFEFSCQNHSKNHILQYYVQTDNLQMKKSLIFVRLLTHGFVYFQNVNKHIRNLFHKQITQPLKIFYDAKSQQVFEFHQKDKIFALDALDKGTKNALGFPQIVNF